MRITTAFLAALIAAASASAQTSDRVRLTVTPPEGGSVSVEPQPAADGTLARGTKVLIKAAPAKGYMIDGIFAGAEGPGKYYNECCAPESLLVVDKDMEVGATFLPKKALSSIRITDNVVYAKPGVKALKYDVFAPKGAKNLPCIIIIHGGGWSMNTEDIMRGMARQMAMSGRYVVFSIDYRFINQLDGGPESVRLYQIVEDVYGAIAHIMEHAAEYGGDAKRLFVTGDSAGGHLSAAAINFADFIGEGGFGDKAGVYEFRPTYVPRGKSVAQLRSDISSALLGAIPTYPVVSERLVSMWDKSPKEELQAVTPVCRIPRASVRRAPQLLLRGTLDGLITDADMQEYIKAMSDAGQEVKYLQVGGIGHAFLDWRHEPASQDRFDRFARPQIRLMLEFCDEIIDSRDKAGK